MIWDVLGKGMVLGFSIAAPVGPIGLLCLRSTLRDGMGAGLASGMGAATADLLYGIAAALGLSAALARFFSGAAWFELAGAAFLVYLGAKTFREQPAQQCQEISPGSPLSSFTTTFLLTLANPMTVLSFVAMFAGLGLGGATGGPLALAAGVFLGSAAWWLCLSASGALLRHRLTPASFLWLNRISGCVIAAFGMRTLLLRWF